MFFLPYHSRSRVFRSDRRRTMAVLEEQRKKKRTLSHLPSPIPPIALLLPGRQPPPVESGSRIVRLSCSECASERKGRVERKPVGARGEERSIHPRGQFLPFPFCGKREEEKKSALPAHLCPVSCGGFESLSVRQIVLCLSRSGSWVSPTSP